MAAAIEIEHLTKVFRLYKEKRTSLKERAIKFGRTPYQKFHALEDVSFDIQSGHTVGLLGHNGSGKSTLLKCMAGIIQPTSGSVRTTGRMAALLELGAGFHPELTGRENVYLNGSILGLKTVEVDRVFDDIVGFAGLETFIDTPVKHYSSGMYIRLGFAVAIHVDPEILLVDEVLSVGDEAFQRKCLDKVRSFQEEGRTIVVVTHNADMVRVMCDWGAALDHGRLVAIGDPNDVIRIFRERLMQGMLSDGSIDPDIARSELSPVWHKVAFADANVVYARPGTDHAKAGEPMQIDVILEAPEPVEDVVVALNIYASNGTMVFGTNTSLLGADLGTVHGRRRVTFGFDNMPLLDGTYSVTLGLHTEGGLVYDSWEQRKHFEMAVAGRSIGIANLPIHVEVEAAAVAAPPASRRAG
jgi:ABC-2 type transport system ATP-binding protein